ncbi:hypothetical protein J40TS1_34210 [Paenibacillus montaniterrae]|uniref:Uncharacterized protein n=1 Tax=Paenibacillus montaniterrae TaxID=429341 RepID=A0A919YTB1_9BACL|nr:hypothetical protein J40TS1_34210 [Paenibacillus montaniterrae]
MQLTKQQKRFCKSFGAILLTLFYIINVQSIHKDAPKQLARQNELELKHEEKYSRKE